MIQKMQKKINPTKKWLGREDLHCIETLSIKEQEICKSSAGLLKILNEKFKPQQSEISLSLQYCKLPRDYSKTEKEWIGQLRMKANECKYQEHD